MDPFPLPERYVGRGALSDPTEGLINNRIAGAMLTLAEEHTIASAEEKERFLPTLFMMANKLGAVWYHRNNYARAEDQRIKAARENPIEPGAAQVLIPCFEELYYELDAFLVQVKSCLDHAVKIPGCFVGRGWNLATFGGRGADVENALRRNIPERFRRRATGLLALVQENRPWLEDVIAVRDRMNHLQRGGIEPKTFTVFAKRADHDVVLSVPMWAGDLTVRAAMDSIWQKLFLFVEKWVGWSVAMRLDESKSLLYRPRPLTDLTSPWEVGPKEVMDAAVAAGGWHKYEPAPEAARARPHRNDPCSCGSGRKYKNCCLPTDEQRLREARR